MASKKQQPEALAEFAETARKEKTGKSAKRLSADSHTSPIPTPNKLKHSAATKVLNEGATGKDRHSEDAIEKLPDRIIESR